MVRHISPTRPWKASGLAWQSASNSVKAVGVGSSPTDCANMLNTPRIRKVATASGVWPRDSSALESCASKAATPRVTSRRRCAGSSVMGSVQMRRNNCRTSGLCRSVRKMRKGCPSENWA